MRTGRRDGLMSLRRVFLPSADETIAVAAHTARRLIIIDFFIVQLDLSGRESGGRVARHRLVRRAAFRGLQRFVRGRAMRAKGSI